MKLDKQAYTQADFSNVIVEQPEITRKQFTNCRFHWTDFTDVEIVYGCVFDECNFTNARLNGVRFKDCAFLSCRFKNASFFATVLEECKMTGSDFTDSGCSAAQIFGGDWSYTVLRKQSFQKQNLSGIRFLGADLSHCCFNTCNLTSCQFDEAVAHETSFYKSDLRGASLQAFPMQEAGFRQAKLDLAQCVMMAEILTEGRYTPEEEKPAASPTF